MTSGQPCGGTESTQGCDTISQEEDNPKPVKAANNSRTNGVIPGQPYGGAEATPGRTTIIKPDEDQFQTSGDENETNQFLNTEYSKLMDMMPTNQMKNRDHQPPPLPQARSRSSQNTPRKPQDPHTYQPRPPRR